MLRLKLYLQFGLGCTLLVSAFRSFTMDEFRHLPVENGWTSDWNHAVGLLENIVKIWLDLNNRFCALLFLEVYFMNRPLLAQHHR